LEVDELVTSILSIPMMPRRLVGTSAIAVTTMAVALPLEQRCEFGEKSLWIVRKRLVIG
jgi:hypothetical protein